MSPDRRIKERRSFRHERWFPLMMERRKTIIVAGRRDKERRVSQDRRAAK